MYIKRKLEATLLRYLKEPEILAVVGPRQSGKTTMIKKIQTELNGSVYISFDKIQTLTEFEKDIDGFAKKYLSGNKYLFIDEFQYAKHGGKNLKYLYDTYPGCKIIISGSSAIDLTIKALKFLTGRVFIFNLYELDFEEYLSFREPKLAPIYAETKKQVNLKSNTIATPQISAILNGQFLELMNEFVVWGGYPRVVTSPSEEKKRTILENIYSTYFLRDIRDTLGLIDDFKLSKLIEAVALQIGQLINYNELGQISGYDQITLKKYLNILDKTFICRMMRPFFTNRRKEISKNPKMYFFDTGLRNHIIQNFNPLNLRNDRGQLYKNFIFTQLLKQDLPINYWRDKPHAAESDFVIKRGENIMPIESKSTLKNKKIPNSLARFISAYRPAHALVLSDDVPSSSILEKSKIHFLPRWLI